MKRSLSNVVNNLDKGIQKGNVNRDTMIKNVKLAELNTKIETAFWNI